MRVIKRSFVGIIGITFLLAYVRVVVFGTNRTEINASTVIIKTDGGKYPVVIMDSNRDSQYSIPDRRSAFSKPPPGLQGMIKQTRLILKKFIILLKQKCLNRANKENNEYYKEDEACEYNNRLIYSFLKYKNLSKSIKSACDIFRIMSCRLSIAPLSLNVIIITYTRYVWLPVNIFVLFTVERKSEL